MDRKVVYVNVIPDAKHIECCLKEGWVLDPELKIVRLDNVAIYHFVKYTEEELLALETVEEPKGKFADVSSIKSVAIDEADDLLKQGYEILDTYAKTVTLIKREVKKNE